MFGSDGERAISPIPIEGTSLNIGFHEIPLLVVFHKFPDPNATYIVPGFFSST